MKTMFTALTRPRIASGVAFCSRTRRTTTLTMSAAPSVTSAASESAKLFESPKTIVAAPNTATATSILIPALPPMGRNASTMAVAPAPTAGAARSIPKPRASTARMSFA